MMHVWAAALLLLAVSTSASVTRTNYLVDKVLNGAGVDMIPLRDISFDVDNQAWTFSGYVEFHMEDGTLGNTRRRVRRQGDCFFSDRRSWVAYKTTPHFTLSCRLLLRGLIAKYNVDVIADDRSMKMVIEVLLDTGYIDMTFETRFKNCSNITCTHIYRWDIKDISAKFKPIKTPMEPWMNNNGLIGKFENIALPRVKTELIHELNTTYLRAVSDKMIPLKAYMFSDADTEHSRRRREVFITNTTQEGIRE